MSKTADVSTYNIEHNLVANNSAGWNLYIKKFVADLIRLNDIDTNTYPVNVEVQSGKTLEESKLIVTFGGGEKRE